MKLILPANQQMHNGFRPYGDPNGRHSGLDFGWASGDVVKAAADGVVLSVYAAGGYNGGWGNRIRIEHAPGVVTTYNHLANGSIKVKTGDRVKAGQLLAIMGDTGKAPNGRHLHFELYLNGVRVDPMPYFSKALPNTAAAAPAPAGAGSGAVVDGPFVKLPKWWYSYGSAADARAGRYKKGVGIGPGTFRVRATDGGALKVETGAGDVWLHPKAAAHLTGQTKAPAAARLHVRLAESWFYYPTEAAARNAKKGHRGPTLPRGDYLVVSGSGPFQVASSKGNVWVGTGRTNPTTVRK